MKTKCLNREEFVVVGWSDPEGSRHRIGSLLLGYYTPEGKLVYAGRVGTGFTFKQRSDFKKQLDKLSLPGGNTSKIKTRSRSRHGR